MIVQKIGKKIQEKFPRFRVCSSWRTHITCDQKSMWSSVILCIKIDVSESVFLNIKLKEGYVCLG